MKGTGIGRNKGRQGKRGWKGQGFAGDKGRQRTMKLVGYSGWKGQGMAEDKGAKGILGLKTVRTGSKFGLNQAEDQGCTRTIRLHGEGKLNKLDQGYGMNIKYIVNLFI